MQQLENKTEEQLRRLLLMAEIRQLDRLNNQTLIEKMVPSLSAIAYSIAAAVVVVLITTFAVDRALDEKSKIEQQKNLLQSEVLEFRSQIDQMQRRRAKLDGMQTSENADVDLNISFEDCSGITCSIVASSSNLNAKIELFGPCAGIFAFPTEVPNFGSKTCPPIDTTSFSCEISGGVQRCKATHITTAYMDAVGWWITASSEGMRSFRYINTIAE